MHHDRLPGHINAFNNCNNYETHINTKLRGEKPKAISDIC